MPADHADDNLQADHNPKAAATYVYFEHTQLTHAAKALRDLTQGQRADTQGGRDKTDSEQIQESILLESFLIHARNLRYFLFDEPKWDDVAAEHYLPEWDEQVEDWCPYLNERRFRLDKSLAHISYKRIEYESGKKWDCGTIYKEITDALDGFLSRLTPEKRDWFTAPRNQSPVRRL